MQHEINRDSLIGVCEKLAALARVLSRPFNGFSCKNMTKSSPIIALTLVSIFLTGCLENYEEVEAGKGDVSMSFLTGESDTVSYDQGEFTLTAKYKGHFRAGQITITPLTETSSFNVISSTESCNPIIGEIDEADRQLKDEYIESKCVYTFSTPNVTSEKEISFIATGTDIHGSLGQASKSVTFLPATAQLSINYTPINALATDGIIEVSPAVSGGVPLTMGGYQYEWRRITNPFALSLPLEANTASLSMDISAIKPEDISSGTVRYQLTVTDKRGVSVSKFIDINITNNAEYQPINFNVVAGDIISLNATVANQSFSLNLDGSNTTANLPEGQTLFYFWHKASGGTAQIVSPYSATSPIVVTGSAGDRFVFTLYVNNEPITATNYQLLPSNQQDSLLVEIN